MIFNVPQFIDIEDKIVGPLTAKQLGWLAMGAVVLLVIYSLADQTTFFFSAVIVAAIFGGLAFYRPYNQPLIKFIMSSMAFATRPKMYIWRRIPDKIQAKNKIATQTTTPTITKKTFDSQRVADISKILDQNH